VVVVVVVIVSGYLGVVITDRCVQVIFSMREKTEIAFERMNR
jgi:hypothetical protein